MLRLYGAEQPRLPTGSRSVSSLPAYLRAMPEAVSGKRGCQCCMREHLVQLGPAAKDLTTEIIYAEPRSRNDSIESLHGLLQLDADDALRATFECHCGRPGCRVVEVAREFARDPFPPTLRDGTNGWPR